MTQAWLAFGCLSMAVGAIIFGFGAHNANSERWRTLYVLNFFIAIIASVLYLAMWLGQGFDVIYDRPTYWVRYVTWTLSTPLLILVLTFLGRTSLSITGSLVGADILMIATGFVATVSPKPTNYIWYIVSCGAFLGITYLLLRQYRMEAEEQFPRSKKVFRRLITIHLFLWTLYPVVWILSSTGFNLLSSTAETASYTLLDVAAKVGFGFLSLNSMSKLEQGSEVRRLERVS